MTPSVTEIVVALGAASELVGVDSFSSKSPEIARMADISALPVAGDFVAPNVEVIAKLRPTLVLLDEAQGKAASSLASAGFKTLIIRMHTIDDTRAAISKIAEAIDASTAGDKLVAKLDAAVAAARRQKQTIQQHPRVLWVLDRQPGDLTNIVAIGRGTYGSELLDMVGAENVITAGSYPKLSREAIARLEVDLILDSSGAAQTSITEWGDTSLRMVQALPTSAATPRPDFSVILGTVSGLVKEASVSAQQEKAP